MRLSLVIITLMLLIPFAGCRRGKGRHRSSKETIISLVVEKRTFRNAPTIFVDKHKVAGWIRVYSRDLASFRFVEGADKADYKKPYSLEYAYTIRPVETIRPITRKGVMHNRAFEVSVNLVLRPLFTTDPGEVLRGTESVWQSFARSRSRELDGLVEQALKEATGKAVQGIWFEADLKKAPPEKLIALLDSKDVKVRLVTVAVIGRRRIPEALDKLISMLKTERYETHKMRIAGVLGQLGDEKAVEPLSEFALSLSDEHTVAVLSIISQIGGGKAETFLQWVAFGHKSKVVQKAAKNLLDKMEVERKRDINNL